MSETAGFGTDWLPPAVQRRMMTEDAREARETRQAEAERADRQDQAHERATEAFRTASESRGEYVSAVALARGEAGGRTLADIFDSVIAIADREDGRLRAAELKAQGVEYLDAPEPQLAARSAWPGSEYQLERQLRQADEMHRSLVAYKARTGYPAAAEAARAKSEPFVERSGRPMIYW